MKKHHLLKSLLLLCALMAGSGSAWADNTESVTFSDVYSDKDKPTTYEGTDFTLTFSSGGGTATQYYSTGSALRLYAKNSMVVTSTTKTISNIELTFGTGDGTNEITTSSGTYSEGTWTGSSKSVTFTVGGTKGNRRISSVKVTFENTTDPYFTVSNITPAYNATSETISYTIDNAVDGATVLAEADVDWITNIAVNTTDKEVTFNLAKNTTVADRVGKVTLTYTKDATELATKDVTVTQGHLDVAAPTFSVDAGTYNTTQSVELATVTDGATIYYTIDNSTPTTSSNPYSTAIAINESKIIKAIAVKDGVSTAVAEAAYELQVATPVISPDGGVFGDSQDVTISCATDGVAIYYTNDDSTPSSSSTAYSAFVLTATTTIKAIATKAGWTDSEVATATFSKIDLGNAFVLTGLSAITEDDVIAIVGNNGSDYAISNDKGTSAAPAAVAVTVSNNVIATAADNIKWNVSGNATDGYVFYPNGSTSTWLYCTNTNNGVRVGDNESNTFGVSSEGYLIHKGTSRYVGIYNSQDWRCYTSINSNIKDQSFAIYKKGISLTLASACTDNTKYYATFSSAVPFKFPAGVTVSEVAIEDGKLKVVDYAAGAVVPANTGVLISSTTPGKVELTLATGNGTSVLGEDNCLKPSGFGILDAKTTGTNCKFYRLTMHNGTQIGFWWGAAEGAAFDIAANKAYLAVPAGTSAREGLWFGDDVTGIGTTLNDNGETINDKPVYNLAGQRVAQPTKGLYIVGGKKIALRGALR